MSTSSTIGRARFAGLSAGTLSFAGAWITGLLIARLTGAAAVLLVLAAGAVALAASAVSSRFSIRSITKIDIDLPSVIDMDTSVDGGIHLHRLPRSGDVHVRVLHGADLLADCNRSDFDADGRAALCVEFPTPGVVDELFVEVVVTGAPGLFWTKRTSTIDVGQIHVAPTPSGSILPIGATPTDERGRNSATRGRGDGDIDGIRPWREGEGDHSVHWASTLRSGALNVHDRSTNATERWTIALDTDHIDHDTGARLLLTITDGLRRGHEVTVTTPSDTRVLTDPGRARSFVAHAIGPAGVLTPPSTPWYRRSIRLRARHETPRALHPASRTATALGSLVATGMLLGALGTPPALLGLVAIGLAIGVAISMRYGIGAGATKPWPLRVGVGIATFAALGYVATTVGGVSGLVQALRGPMPDLLMLLLVVHGLEIIDQRTQRVHQAIASVIVAYAAGLRIDDRVGWWLAAWAIVMIVAVRTSTRIRTAPAKGADRRRAGSTSAGRITNRQLAMGAGSVVASCLAVLAVLSVVPVPDGPARIGLPALSNNAPSPATPGALAGPSGEVPDPSTERSGSLGEVGGYPGFSETLDTSVRGDLGDDLVMRVRASEPAFWRGQTFTEFNGRTWTVAADNGTRRAGPTIDVPATLGDLPARRNGVETDDFIQTYYIETDLPNVVFAASRPDVVTFDGSVWTRPDGSMRSNVTLTEGSVYTVVSERVQVTPDILHQQGDIAETFAAVSNPDRQARLAPYLAIPDSTTARTIELAATLRQPGDSTYQTILRYQRWLGENTAYDLNAPIPDVGADAVDDYLFESQRGFCEQIASSLAIMLRSQGVPTRIATGYIPGERNQVSGVFEVRASDAHAWVEVWFPETGWESFDPTAQVPLAGEAQPSTVGGDLISAAISGIASRPVEIGLLVGVGLDALGTVRTVTQFVRRRRRGRWGVLQDRFTELAEPTATTNPVRAESFDDPRIARELAELLDRAAFDPDWADDDEAYRRARARVDSLL